MIIKDKIQLQIPCKEASIFEAPAIIKLLEKELINSSELGIGLSAIQIGVLKKIFIMRMGSNFISLVNPKVIDAYDLREFHNEACLSFPGDSITTKRFNEIYIKDDLHPAGLIFTGLEAVITQHEMGHLNEQTMYDYEIKIPKRNEMCWCNSGRKYKLCHLNKKDIKWLEEI